MIVTHTIYLDLRNGETLEVPDSSPMETRDEVVLHVFMNQLAANKGYFPVGEGAIAYPLTSIHRVRVKGEMVSVNVDGNPVEG